MGRSFSHIPDPLSCPFPIFPPLQGGRGSPKSRFLADVRSYSVRTNPMGEAALKHEAEGFPITQPSLVGRRTHAGIGKARRKPRAILEGLCRSPRETLLPSRVIAEPTLKPYCLQRSWAKAKPHKAPGRDEASLGNTGFSFFPPRIPPAEAAGEGAPLGAPCSLGQVFPGRRHF